MNDFVETLNILVGLLEMARKDFRGHSVVLVCVLKGSFIFAADLARAIDAPVRVEFLGVRSYGNNTVSSGAVQIT